jgi:hypothetical protein
MWDMFEVRKGDKIGEILTWGGMGKYYKYLHDQFEIFTYISNIKVRNLCTVSGYYLTANKSYDQKPGRHQNLKRLVALLCHRSPS